MFSFILKVSNSKGYNPYRDSKGRFTDGPVMNAVASFKNIQKLEEDKGWSLFNPVKTAQIEKQITIEKQKISRMYQTIFKNNGMALEYSKQKHRLELWGQGNGFRDEKTGKYVSTPLLEKFKDSPAQKLHSAITQAILRESGIKEITLFRGDSIDITPKGLTSYSENSISAASFGKIKKKIIPVNKVITHHLLDAGFRYSSEYEIIIDD